MILDTPLDAAWAALSTLGPVRGTIAGHTGTARLEEVDDDTHTATLRLQGTGPSGPVTATVTATLEPSGDGTRLHLATRAHPHPPDAASIEVVAATLAAAISARPVEPARTEPAPSAAAVAAPAPAEPAGAEPVPSAPVATEPVSPVPVAAEPALSAPGERRRRWVAVGVACAGIAVVASRRRR